MNKEKFNELAVNSGFVLVRCMDKKYRIASEYNHDVIEDELYVFKNLLLDEVIKELNKLSVEISLGLVTDKLIQMKIKAAIEKLEAMK